MGASTEDDIDTELLGYLDELRRASSGCLDSESIGKLYECSLSGEGLVRVRVGGSKLLVPCSHLPEAWANILHVYCTRDYELVATHVPRRGWVVIDAGAYLGFYTVRAGLLMSGDGLVVAVEPLAENRAILEENVVLNGLESVVRLDPRALSSEEGVGVITVSCYPATSSLVREHVSYHGDACGERKVRTVELSRLLLDHSLDRVDLVKLDIEGSELAVLSRSGWEERVERLVVEVHTDVVRLEDIIGLLEERGYRTWWKSIGEAQVMVYAW